MRSTNKLEKSRQSARECRARKKLRYQVPLESSIINIEDIISVTIIFVIVISITSVMDIIMQYLDDMILEREKANDALREELTKYVGWCQMLDQSQVFGHEQSSIKHRKNCKRCPVSQLIVR